jgi:hypothetical protein
VIVRYGSKNTITDIRPAQLIFPRRHTFDGNKKPASLGHPLRDRMWQPFTDRQIHWAMVIKAVDESKPVWQADW